MNKPELRVAMKRRNCALTPDEKRAAAERIFAAVEALPEFAQARCVACFCALPDEPPTAEVLWCWSRSKRVVVPRVEGDTMRFYDYRPDALVRGAFGIDEPTVSGGPVVRECPPETLDLVVVPGVAFTRSGARLGRGRGYYDRYLSQPELRAFCVGICFAHQLVDALPVEPHDRAMDAVCAG